MVDKTDPSNILSFLVGIGSVLVLLDLLHSSQFYLVIVVLVVESASYCSLTLTSLLSSFTLAGTNLTPFGRCCAVELHLSHLSYPLCSLLKPKPSAVEPISRRIGVLFSKVCIDLEVIHSAFKSDFPFWLPQPPEIDISLTSHNSQGR